MSWMKWSTIILAIAFIGVQIFRIVKGKPLDHSDRAMSIVWAFLTAGWILLESFRE